MFVRELWLKDFRSYPVAELGLSPGVNVLIGANGHGKTNLIEAIGYLATLASHRVSTDAPLVHSGAGSAMLRLDVRTGARATTIEVIIEPGRAKRARINRTPASKASAILGIARVVTFAPEDLALVKGDPSDRRKFLDEVLIQRRPLVASIRADYERVLKQRNALLRSSATARRSSSAEVERTLSVWDEQLADLGAGLTAARVGLVHELSQPASDAYSRISDDPERKLVLTYESAVVQWLPDASRGPLLPITPEPWRQALLDGIAHRRREELDRGVTLVGPQRDDLGLRLGEQPAKGYASHGESWSIALALRLGCFQILRVEGEDPILILDDVFAELDAKRRARLVSMIRDAEQVIITAAVAQDVPAEIDGRRFLVTRGSVTEEVA